MNMKMFFIVAVMTSLSAQNLSAQNNQDSTNTDIAMTDTLKEVLVKPEDVVRYKNKVTYTISDEMRRGTFTTLGVLQHLPGFVSMGMDNEMSYKGSEKVIILKDGKEKDMSYITDLSHLRFKKVEILKSAAISLGQFKIKTGTSDSAFAGTFEQSAVFPVCRTEV